MSVEAWQPAAEAWGSLRRQALAMERSLLPGKRPRCGRHQTSLAQHMAIGPRLALGSPQPAIELQLERFVRCLPVHATKQGCSLMLLLPPAARLPGGALLQVFVVEGHKTRIRAGATAEAAEPADATVACLALKM